MPGCFSVLSSRVGMSVVNPAVAVVVPPPSADPIPRPAIIRAAWLAAQLQRWELHGSHVVAESKMDGNITYAIR